MGFSFPENRRLTLPGSAVPLEAESGDWPQVLEWLRAKAQPKGFRLEPSSFQTLHSMHPD